MCSMLQELGVVYLIYEMTQGVNKNQLVIITNKHQINQLYCMH